MSTQHDSLRRIKTAIKSIALISTQSDSNELRIHRANALRSRIRNRCEGIISFRNLSIKTSSTGNESVEVSRDFKIEMPS